MHRREGVICMADVEAGGCECDCARCNEGSHCGEEDNGCRFYDDDDD